VTGDPSQSVLFNALEEMLTLTGSRGFTVTVVTAEFVQVLASVTVYVIICVPTEGSKLFPETPVPLHVPPVGEPERGTRSAFAHTEG